MNIDITAIRSNGSPITQNFNLDYRYGCTDKVANQEHMLKTIQGWSEDNHYGGIIRIFENYEREYENCDGSISQKMYTNEFESVAQYATYLNGNDNAAMNRWTKRGDDAVERCITHYTDGSKLKSVSFNN